jgi:hypothetical protein
MAERTTYRGSDQELADVVKPFATEPNFFKYDQDAKTANKQMLKSGCTFLQAMKQVSPNLSFTNKKIKNCLHLVWKDCRENWDQKLTDKFEKDWVQTMQKRIGLAIKHIKKSAKSKWAIQIFGLTEDVEAAADEVEAEPAESTHGVVDAAEPDDAAETDAESPESEAADEEAEEATKSESSENAVKSEPAVVKGEEKPKPEYVGFDDEVGKAYKSTTNAKGKTQTTVYAEIFAPDGSNDDSFVVAKFPGDDKPTEITDITVADFKVRQNSTWECTRGPLFQGTAKSGELVKLAKSIRKGQESVVIQWVPEGGKKRQVTEIVTEKLGEDVSERRKLAVSIGKELCVGLIDGKLAVYDVNQERDKLMSKHMNMPDDGPAAKRSKRAHVDTQTSLASSSVQAPTADVHDAATEDDLGVPESLIPCSQLAMFRSACKELDECM